MFSEPQVSFQANILIDDDGTARLTDFGLSTTPEFEGTSYNSSTFGGAIRWLAPELLTDSSKRRLQVEALSPASDVYYLGAVILQVSKEFTSWDTLMYLLIGTFWKSSISLLKERCLCGIRASLW